MSGKFATMTASLLARKGDATPAAIRDRMSHDLRTPLNAIIGFSEVMRQEMFGPVGSAKYREYSRLIHESGEQLLDLLEEVNGQKIQTALGAENELDRPANGEGTAPHPQASLNPPVPFPVREPIVRSSDELPVSREPITRLSDGRPVSHQLVQEQDKRHRISLALSSSEHERLSIVAVKKGVTRHQLMRQGLDFYFEKLATEYSPDCACIATGGCKNGCDDAEE